MGRSARWRRDPGVQEMVDFFSRPEFFDAKKGAYDPSRLTSKHSELIAREVIRCRKSFEYTARNYFWIADENRQDVLFSLWEAQELILEKIYQSWDEGRTAFLVILKARRMGCSTLIESLIAWQTMFFANVNSLVVSYDKPHAARLFDMTLRIVDKMPWFLVPPIKYKEYKSGIVFDTADGSLEEGLKSRVMVDSASDGHGGIAGVGDRVTNFHSSELSRWGQETAQQIIESDIGPAISKNGTGVAVIESTARGAGTYYHELWRRSVEKGQFAKWTPVFIPFFFEKTRVLPPLKGWRIEREEAEVKEVVAKSWVRCDNEDCAQFFEMFFAGESRSGSTCGRCKKGTLTPYQMTDEQLCWLWNERMNAEGDEKSMRNLAQEYAVTAESAFQITGEYVFPRTAMDQVFRDVCDPIWAGDLDKNGAFHGLHRGRCFQSWCSLDHRRDNAPIQIWELPLAGFKYAMSIDPAGGGGGSSDYAVIWINRIGQNEDQQAAMFRSNTTDPVALAHYANYLGRWYNSAMAIPETNRYETTLTLLRMQYAYPNIYQQKNLDGGKILKQKFGFNSTPKSKGNAVQLTITYITSRVYRVRSRIFAEEIKTFQKEDWEDTAGRAVSKRFKDDTVMACCIACYGAHDLDFRHDLGTAVIQNRGNDQDFPYEVTCKRCDTKFGSDGPATTGGCIECGSLFVSFRRKPQGRNLDAVVTMQHTESSPEKDFSAL